jgi:superfamily II DNA/RNA helicase
MNNELLSLGIPPRLVAALEKAGIRKPFEIQQKTIPDALEGHDICGRAPTGSGKTIAFGIPLIARINKGKPKRPSALILAPTRELAEQISVELRPFARIESFNILPIYGGVSIHRQIQQLRRGVDIIVATPGRLIDLLDRNTLKLDQIEFVVIDEADRMADMGFLPQIKEVLAYVKPDRQTLLFSATLDGDVKILTQQYQNNPVRHEVGSSQPDIHSMTHKFWSINRSDRIPMTAQVIEKFGRTIVFTRSKYGADRTAQQLLKAGVNVAAIHGDLSQHKRKNALASFSNGKVQALIATDVAARGIHVDSVECVIHYDPPANAKDYTHRSGRTARAGSKGTVISYVDRVQNKLVTRLQKTLRLSMPIIPPDIQFKSITPKDINSSNYTGNKKSFRKNNDDNNDSSSRGHSSNHTGNKKSFRKNNDDNNDSSSRGHSSNHKKKSNKRSKQNFGKAKNQPKSFRSRKNSAKNRKKRSKQPPVTVYS